VREAMRHWIWNHPETAVPRSYFLIRTIRPTLDSATGIPILQRCVLRPSIYEAFHVTCRPYDFMDEPVCAALGSPIDFTITQTLGYITPHSAQLRGMRFYPRVGGVHTVCAQTMIQRACMSTPDMLATASDAGDPIAEPWPSRPSAKSPSSPQPAYSMQRPSEANTAASSGSWLRIHTSTAQ
jgi:hypothetical protein